MCHSCVAAMLFLWDKHFDLQLLAKTNTEKQLWAHFARPHWVTLKQVFPGGICPKLPQRYYITLKLQSFLLRNWICVATCRRRAKTSWKVINCLRWHAWRNFNTRERNTVGEPLRSSQTGFHNFAVLLLSTRERCSMLMRHKSPDKRPLSVCFTLNEGLLSLSKYNFFSDNRKL